MIYFCSDIHFYHNNILKFVPERQEKFGDMDTMNKEIVKAWNKTVTLYDTVFFLGDFSFKRRAFNEILPMLNGNINFIMGNHDWKYYKEINKCCNYVTTEQTMFIDGLCVYMIHDPAEATPKDNVNLVLHGHVHEKWKTAHKVITVFDEGKQQNVSKKIGCPYMNMSVEQWDYKPVSWESVFTTYLVEQGYEESKIGLG